MTTRVYKNFVEGTLASGIAGTGTTNMSVTFATNATVPVTADFDSKHIYFVIDPEGAEHAPEIVKGTAISGSGPYDITIARSQNGTSPQVWDSGRKVVAALIEEDITNFATKDGTTFTGAVTVGNVLDITDTTDSSDATGDTGALRVEGGASIAKKLYVGTDLDVDGTANLDVVDIDGNLTIDGDVDLNGAIDISGTAGSSNLQVTFAEGYKIYADNTTTGGGAANSRIWFEAPDNGEMVLGPRTGGHELHNMRLRATTIAAEGAINVTGLLTANGGLTIQDGDTFTFDTEALTDCIDSGETFTRSDTALATTGAIVDNFLQYDVDGGADQGATLYIQASEPYANGHSDGVKGDIWIDT